MREMHPPVRYVAQRAWGQKYLRKDGSHKYHLHYLRKGGSRCAREELSGASSQKGLLMTPSKQVKAKIEAVEPVPLPAAKRPAMAAILMGALLPEGGPL